MLSDIDRAVSALHAIPNDLPGDDWLRLSMASKNAGVDFEAWHDWCKGASNYLSESDCRARWKSIDPDGAVKAGTLYKTAAEHGWRIGGNTTPRPAPALMRSIWADTFHATAGTNLFTLHNLLRSKPPAAKRCKQLQITAAHGGTTWNCSA